MVLAVGPQSNKKRLRNYNTRVYFNGLEVTCLVDYVDVRRGVIRGTRRDADGVAYGEYHYSRSHRLQRFEGRGRVVVRVDPTIPCASPREAARRLISQGMMPAQAGGPRPGRW
jgi:hypothetical protein